MMSFAVDPAGSVPSTVIASVFASLLRQRLRREHVLDLARADAERERAERTVRRGVAVTAHDRHARQRAALFGPITCTMPCPGSPIGKFVMPNSAAFARSVSTCLRLTGSAMTWPDRCGPWVGRIGGHVVVLGGDREVGPADARGR